MRKFNIFILLFLFTSLTVFAANKKVIEEQIRSLSATLQEKKIDYQKIRKQYRDLMIQISNTDSRIMVLKNKIRYAKKGLKLINKKISVLKRDIGRVSAKLLGQRKILQGELKSYYEYSLISPYYNNGVWFTKMNAYVANYVQDRIKNYINKRAYLKDRIEQLSKYKRRKQQIIEEIKDQQNALKSQKQQLKNLAAQAKQKKVQYLGEISRITKQQEGLRMLLNKIIEEEKRRKELLARRKRMQLKERINPRLVVKEFSALAKKVPPPVSGRLVSRFGRKYDPLFKVYTRNDGIDIEAKKGSCVRTIAYGKIDFVGNLPGYGGVVIINHLNGYYTVYGGVRSFYKVGKIVKAYQCIGRLTSTRLHFEIRRHATPLNPLNYLDRRFLK